MKIILRPRNPWVIVIMLSIAVGGLFHACEFESKDIYFRELEEPEVEIPIVELNVSDSILFIVDEAYLRFNISFEKQEVVKVEFVLDDGLFATIEDSNGEVLIRSTPGEHQLDMIIYTTVESGSLASQLDVEGFVYSNSWIVVIGDI